MYKIIFLFTWILFFSCSGNKTKQVNKDNSDTLTYSILNKNNMDTLSETLFFRTSINKRLNDSIISISILPGIGIHWNNKVNKIENDSLFQKIKYNFQN